MSKESELCNICPRMCGTFRHVNRGYCGADDVIEVSKIMLHRWEEPPVSGYYDERGSGAIFFTHCPLGCVYCQNGKISRRGCVGEKYTPDSLAREMLALESRGAYNINLVSPTQYTSQLIEAVAAAKKRGLTVPVVWNTGGYERAETISHLAGTVDIFLTDFKYASPDLAQRLSSARDYPEYALDALRAMYEVVGRYEYYPSPSSEKPLLRCGIIVRHLVLPSHREDSLAVLKLIAHAVPPENILLSLMAQYTPYFLPDVTGNDLYSDIRRKITTYEYEKVCGAAREAGFDGFMQERSSATSRFTPDF